MNGSWSKRKMPLPVPPNIPELEICNPAPGTGSAVAPRHNAESGPWRGGPTRVFGDLCKLANSLADS